MSGASDLAAKVPGVAYIANQGELISFSYGGRVIRFRGPYSLNKIQRVKKWDKGYLVLMADYANSPEPVEDYIDLVPILEDLYIDAGRFLQNVKQVEVRYA